MGDREWNLGEASDILVTISEELNIIVPANKTNLALYIDVSLKSIQGFSLDPRFVTGSQRPTYRLIISLKSGLTSNCILNATEHTERHVVLMFASKKDADTLNRLLVSTNVGANGFTPPSHSDAIDVSEAILSDDELAAPGAPLINRQTLMRTASLAHAIIPHERPVSTINPSRLESVHTSHVIPNEIQEGSSSSVAEHDEDSQRVSHSVEMAVEGIDVSQAHDCDEQAIEGINASGPEFFSNEETPRYDIQAGVSVKASSNARVRQSQVLSNRTREPMGNFERTSDNGLPSSLRWHTDPNAIQDDPDFRAGTPQRWPISSAEPVENKISYADQDGEHDYLYYASPKVTDGQRKSQRNLARDSNPEKLKWPLASTVRQANVVTGPPTKLSRQLRNANGFVESNTEQTADDDFATSTNDRAGGVKASENRKRNKAVVPTKVKTAIKESTKPVKKMAQSKKKAPATEEPPNTSIDNYDIPPSPTRVDSIMQTSKNKKKGTTTRPKATEAPHSNRKQTKSVPRKVAATTSAIGPAPQSKTNLMNTVKANGSIQDLVSNMPSGKKVDDDVDMAHSEGKPQILGQSRQPAKTAKKQEVRAPKTKKNMAQTQLRSDEVKAKRPAKANTQAPLTRLVKAKPAPAAISRPRLRRTAAIKADKRIQGLEESDEIVDDEVFVPALTRSSNRSASLEAAEAPEKQKIKEAGDKGPTSRGKVATAKFSTKDSIPDSVSPDLSDEHRPDSLSDPKADSGLNNVHLVRAAPAEALQALKGGATNSVQKKIPTSAAETSMIGVYSKHGDHSNQPNPTSVEKGVEVNEAMVNLVPDGVPQLYEAIAETEPVPTRPQQDNHVRQGHAELDAPESADARDQDQFEHSLPYIDDVHHELGSEPESVGYPQAPTAPKVVEVSQRRISPRLVETVEKLSAESIARRRDPFGEKLNALMLEPRNIKTKVKGEEASGDGGVDSKGLNALKIAELARSSVEPKAGAFERLGATPFREAKRVDPRIHSKSAMQVDGKGEDTTTQILKPAGILIPASQVKPKRKVEQVGITSHKKVRLAPRELKGGSATGKSAWDSKKTPPPVVSNRPLVIGFSATGPSNQGMISSKKQKLLKDVNTGVPSGAELREHGIPNPTTIDQVEAGFISVHETLETPPADIQHDLKDAGDAQKKARSSPQREPAEHLKTVNAIEVREANMKGSRAQKRKLALFVDDPAPWEHNQLSKRQKRAVETPPTVHNHHPKISLDLSPTVMHDRSQRVNSQNTRVNQHGSPMPFFINRGENMAAEELCSDDDDDGKDALAKARLEEQIVLQDNDPILPEPTLLRPLVSAVSVSRPNTTAYQTLSSNSKQVPSSPHAPSVFGTMPPHHIYRNGAIVNAETKESIVSVEAQDPFLGTAPNPQNSFMNAIRRSNEDAAKRFISRANDKRGSRDLVMRPSLNVGEDPDKTLVEPNLRNLKFTVSGSSSRSQSGSSTQALQVDESSAQESDADTEAKWRKALEPHQENMLECLLKISHVSAHIWQ